MISIELFSHGYIIRFAVESKDPLFVITGHYFFGNVNGFGLWRKTVNEETSSVSYITDSDKTSIPSPLYTNLMWQQSRHTPVPITNQPI